MTEQLRLLENDSPPPITAKAEAHPLPALDHVRRRATVTVDNGERHATLRFSAWQRGGRKGSGYDTPELYFVDTLDRERVARVRVYHGAGGLRSYRFYAVDGADRALSYAAHICFLHLTGIDTGAVVWRDLDGRTRQPTDRYTLLPMSECLRCGRRLTAPASIHLALGPECRRMEGLKAAERTRSL